MVLSSESFATNITRVGPFVRVCSFVNKQVVRFGKLSVAIFANKLFLRSRRSARGLRNSLRAADGVQLLQIHTRVTSAGLMI